MLRNGERIAIKGRSYRLDGVLSNGAGSYGQVWAATDSTGRAVAIKLINAEAMTQAAPTLHDHWHRHLEREINFLRGLDADQSRHVVALLDHGAVDGQPALVLERLQANLGQWLAYQRREGASPPDLAQILDWAEQILNGLDVVHRAGFVYRDLKFSNLLVGGDGARIKLADFGSLKREDGDNTRSFIGTPATMAPEQVLPARQGAEGYEYAVDYRADYYALGLLLFALFTDQPTTAAQRRLGQLLAVYGQEGAGQRGAQLGGLNDEERELLRRSIEFWTVPARPEQGGGAAALLVELIDRLLARDPTNRPADAEEIHAALNAARVDSAAVSTLPSSRHVASPVGSPNRHSRRANLPWSRFQRRWALLAGTLGLAGALAGVLIHSVDETDPDRAEPLSAVIAPPTAQSPVSAAPAMEPTLSASSSSPANVPPLAEPAAPPLPADALPMASPGAPPITDAPVAEASEPASTADAPVVETPEPVDVLPAPARFAPAESQAVVEPRAKSGLPTTVVAPRSATTPATVESRPSVRAKPAVSPKPGRPAPAPTVTADRPAVIERSPVADRPVAAPTTASRTMKPTPPAALEPPQRPSVTARTVPTPRNGDSSHPADRARPVSSAAPRPSAAPKPVSKPTEPVARAKPPSQVASRAEPPPALPPIKLESRPEPAPALPPIQLESRRQAAPSVRPPIELVSRSSDITPTAHPVPAVTRVEPSPPSHSATPPARSTDPMTQLRDDAGRAATEVGNFFSRASTTVGKEVRRGLEAADQTVGRWTGRCQPGDSCQEVRVERRDRWSDQRRGGNTVSRRESSARYDEDDGFARPPPRPYRNDYR